MGLLFPKNPPRKLSNFLKFLFCSCFVLFCFPKVEKLNYSAIYESIILKFGGHFPLMIIYKFCKKDFSLQPPGDPREQHQGDARQRTSSSNFFFLCKSIYRRYICEKIRSYHQKNLRDNIKVKVHKEYCDEIFFLQFLSHL